MAKKKYVQIENKNAILELLRDGKKFERIMVAGNAFKDPKTREIINLTGQMGKPVDKVARRSLTRRSKTSSHESVIGLMEVENQYTLDGFLEMLAESKQDPFVLIFGDIRYPHNVGAILRTAYAAGVNGVITPVDEGNFLTDEIVRISMGTALRIPIVEASLFSAIKGLKKLAIKVIALDMDHKLVFDSNLTGPVAFLLGSEDTGVSSKLMERVDEAISIPMRPGLGSLNVSVSASVVMYEKVRQEFKL